MMAKRFSDEFKQEAVQYALAHSDQPLTAIAAQLGIGYSTLDKWVRQLGSSGSSVRLLTQEQQQIKVLEREIKELKAVNDILKKAHVYFVNNPSK
jgi:transposase